MQSTYRESRDSIAPHVTEPSQEIVTVVAQARGVDPMELEPLYDVMDPDALDDLCESSDGNLELAFDYADVRVVVTSEEIAVVS